ncbi:MAG: c-type cytochrome [Acidobacteriaceae bacterium]|nr:c-type cytochrome [Acidobacteriaceae bacterium]
MKIPNLLLGFSIAAMQHLPAQTRASRLPEAPGRDVYLRICGSCHSGDIVAGRGMSREGWSAIVTSMVSRGAKGTEAELAQVVDYLATNLPPHTATAGTAPAARTSGLGASMGPNDAQVVDSIAADKGKTIYIAECITCHGNRARGANANVAENQKGPDLVRSLIVLHDRYGSTLGPFLKKGHPMQGGGSSANLTAEQITGLSHFLHEKVNDTLRSGPYSQIQNVLTGDPKAGQTYFNGAGRCSTCHSPTGDLAGIAKKYDPPTLQSKFLFPRTLGFGRRAGITLSKPVTVTATPNSGPSVTGVLLYLDDFTVALRDPDGDYHAWKRTPSIKVEKHDPYQAHVDLLDQYTDKDMHNIVAYLETLK